MIKKGFKFLIEKTILVLWGFIGVAVTLFVFEMLNGGMGHAGWMGFVYICVASLSFLVLRMLRVVQEWLETPAVEEI